MTNEQKFTEIYNTGNTQKNIQENQGLVKQSEAVVNDFDRNFSNEELKKIEKISNDIDPKDNNGLIMYGTNLQNDMAQFSNQILDDIKSKNAGEIGKSLSELMVQLKSIDPNDLNPKKNIFTKLFKQTKNAVDNVMAQSQTVASNVDNITRELDMHKSNLIRDIEYLDGLYEKNQDYFKEVSIYIEGAKRKRDQLRNENIPALKEKTQNSDNHLIAQEIADVEQFVDRLDKKIHDLQVSRQVSIQTASQLRIIQNVNQTTVEKIQSAILNSVPIWRNQLSIALTLFRQKNAIESANLMTEMTNEMLKTNASMLKQNAIETAKQNERGIIDIETLKQTQRDVIETVRTTIDTQREGSLKRQQIEKELELLEEDLKQHLLNTK